MKRHITQVVDDKTGEPIPEGQGREVTISLNNKVRVLDLSDDSFAQLEQDLAPWLSIGATPAAAGVPRPASATATKKRNSEYLAKVRAWAAENGHTVSDRGRIPNDILTAYEESAKSNR